ncbi:hypothetical protein SFR_1627 [Streptomyces sp. FR-008]|nr:hypothetical protein SFR_1627 [Streptomyces sp. FR-008]
MLAVALGDQALAEQGHVSVVGAGAELVAAGELWRGGGRLGLAGEGAEQAPQGGFPRHAVGVGPGVAEGPLIGRVRLGVGVGPLRAGAYLVGVAETGGDQGLADTGHVGAVRPAAVLKAVDRHAVAGRGAAGRRGAARGRGVALGGHASLDPRVQDVAGALRGNSVAVASLGEGAAGAAARFVVQGAARGEGGLGGLLVAPDGDLYAEAAHVVPGAVRALATPPAALVDVAGLVDHVVIADAGPPLGEVLRLDGAGDGVAGRLDVVRSVVVNEELGKARDGELCRAVAARVVVPRLGAPRGTADDRNGHGVSPDMRNAPGAVRGGVRVREFRRRGLRRGSSQP